MEQKTAKKRKSKSKAKLCRAVGTVAAIVDLMATSMKVTLTTEGICDTKQLKELAGTLKELSAIVSDMEKADEEKRSDSIITVSFEGEGEQWAG